MRVLLYLGAHMMAKILIKLNMARSDAYSIVKVIAKVVDDDTAVKTEVPVLSISTQI
jgi:hypothetical protein